MPRYHIGPSEFTKDHIWKFHINQKEVKVREYGTMDYDGAIRKQTLFLANGESTIAKGLSIQPDAPLFCAYPVKQYHKNGVFIKKFSFKRKDPFNNIDSSSNNKNAINNTRKTRNKNRSKKTTYRARNVFHIDNDNDNDDDDDDDDEYSPPPNDNNNNRNNHNNNNRNNTNNNRIPPHQEFFYFDAMDEQKIKDLELLFKKYPQNKMCNSALQDISTARKCNRFLKKRYYNVLEFSVGLKIQSPSPSGNFAHKYTDLDDIMRDDRNDKSEKYETEMKQNDCDNDTKMKAEKKFATNKFVENAFDFSQHRDYCCVCQVVIECTCNPGRKSCECLKNHWYTQIEYLKDKKHMESRENVCVFSSVCRARIKTFGNAKRLHSHHTSLHSVDRRETPNLSSRCKKIICPLKYKYISSEKFKHDTKHKCTSDCEAGKVECKGPLYSSWKSQRGKYLLRCRRCTSTTTPQTDSEKQMVNDNVKTRQKIKEDFGPKVMKCPMCDLTMNPSDIGNHIQQDH